MAFAGTPDERVLRRGLDIAVRVQGCYPAAPEDVVAELDRLDPVDLRDLVLLLAACVDVSRPVREVVWWTHRPVTAVPRVHGTTPQPCGTPAAYRRHKVHGEDVDLACEVAYLLGERARKATRRRPARRPTPTRRVAAMVAAGADSEQILATLRQEREG